LNVRVRDDGLNRFSRALNNGKDSGRKAGFFEQLSYLEAG